MTDLIFLLAVHFSSYATHESFRYSKAEIMSYVLELPIGDAVSRYDDQSGQAAAVLKFIFSVYVSSASRNNAIARYVFVRRQRRTCSKTRSIQAMRAFRMDFSTWKDDLFRFTVQVRNDSFKKESSPSPASASGSGSRPRRCPETRTR